ncbi:MAG: hypothetical protein WCR54_08315 [Clostridia bacterium]
MKKDESQKRAIGRMVIIIFVLILTLTMVAVSSYAWYNEDIEAAYQLDVDASGVLYLYVETPIKPIPEGEEEERTLYPAKAMPGAVANGLRLNPLELYDAEAANPSYVSKITSSVSYDDKFVLQQAIGSETDVNYSISVSSSHDDTGFVYDNAEFCFSEVKFSYWETITTVIVDEFGDPILDDEGNEKYEAHQEKKDALVSQTGDKTSGVMRITDAESIDFTITMYLANVDELMDDNLLGTSIWIKISLVAQIV